MSAQTNYNYFPVHGAPGGIVDVNPIAIDTRIVEENTGVVFPGMGVVTGTTAGVQIKLPTSSATAADVEGIAINRRTTERDLAGDLYVRNKSAIGVVKWGRVYARLAASVTPAYNDALYLVISGNDAGCFTNTSGETAIAVNGRFLGGADGGAAPVELYNSAATSAAPATNMALSNLTDVDTTGVEDGKVLKYVGADSMWKPGTDET